uniref:glycosyltransferase family 2 protein n=1 Tax=Gelidibacter sp. TaxID=2018083 RepID=UPI00404B5FDF
MSIKCSLVISTYNWPDALEIVLESVLKQSAMPYEVIIADDGSTQTTKDIIENYKLKATVPIIHIWHQDEGFTKSVILNKAVAIARGNYIVQIDGDCIIHKHFVKNHLQFAQENTFLYGSRVNIKPSYLPILFADEIVSFTVFSKGIKKRTRALYMPFLSMFYPKKHEVSKKYRGCNTSYFKSDFIAINGYDERFKGWGREDSELAWRFYNNGLYSKRLRYTAILYHIYHKEKPKDRLELNNDIELNTKKNKVTWCENGINKYLNEKS